MHNLPELVDYFGTEDAPKFLCTMESPCEFGGPGHHNHTRGNSKEFTPYPHALCQTIVNIVTAALAKKRKQPLCQDCAN